MTLPDAWALQEAGSIPPIPIRRRMFGPLTLRRRWRTFAIWAVIYVACVLLLAKDISPGWNAWSLGLIFPGAGFLYGGGLWGVLFAIAAFIAFPIALVNWFASGNISIVLAVWWGGACLSARFAGASAWPWVAHDIPIVVAAGMAFWVVRNRLTFRTEIARAHAHNAALAGIPPLLRNVTAPAMPREMTPLQLAAARRTFDKALQPLNQWNGIALDVEQWQLSATRYQLNAASWQMAAVNYAYTPAFTGYLREAQANLILRSLDRRVWGFWFWENLWGNYDANPDPIRRDNIMVSGYTAQIVGMFETLTGDRRFDREGALTYRWNDKKIYRYAYGAMIDALMHNFARYDYRWMPCEPGLIYSPCNFIGFTALRIYDRLRGTDKWGEIRERVTRSCEDEFTHGDGRIACLTFSRLGLRAPTLSSVLGEAGGIACMTALWPEKAEQLWQVMKREFIKRQPDGSIRIARKYLSWDMWDSTNYYVRPMLELKPIGSLLIASMEMGDEEVQAALSAYIDGKYGAGVSAAIALGRQPGLWRNLVLNGMPESWRVGPILSDAAYPEVLVARAVTDGAALDLVLRPGAGAARTRLGFERLLPGKRYRVMGMDQDEVTADSLGGAHLTMQLNDRAEVRLTPD